MNSNDHAALRELIPAYALGSLDAGEAADVERHMQGCASCRVELADYSLVVDALMLAAPAASPSPALRRSLLAATSAHYIPSARAAPSRRRGVDRPLSTRRAWPVLAVVALAAVVLGGLLWAAAGRSLLSGRAVTLIPTGIAPGASGELRIERGDRITLEVVGLPPLPTGSQYQLWLVAGDERDSGAVFSVDDNGWAEVPVEANRSAADYERFGITIEPAGGSPDPTGERVLGSES